MFGRVGFEAALVLANLVWARLGLFDGGLGIEVEDGVTAEVYTPIQRKEILFCGVNFKIDFTYCTTCGISVFHEMGDTLFGDGSFPFAGRRLEAAELTTYDLTAHTGYDLDGTKLAEKSSTRRLSEEVTTPMPEPLDVVDMLSRFLEELSRLDLTQALSDAIARAPDQNELSLRFAALVGNDRQLLRSARLVFEQTAVNVESAHTPVVVAQGRLAPVVSAFRSQVSSGGLDRALELEVGTATLDQEVSRLIAAVEGDGLGPSLASAIEALSGSVSSISSVTAAHTNAQLAGPSLYAAWLLTLVQPQGPLDSLRIDVAATELRAAAAELDRARVDSHAVASEFSAAGLSLLPRTAGPTSACSSVNEVALGVLTSVSLDTVCCNLSVALAALIDDVGAEAFMQMHSVLKTLRGGYYAGAAARLRATSFCSADSTAARCGQHAAAISAGCTVVDHWASGTPWSDTVLSSFRASSGAFGTSVASGAATLTFDATLTFAGNLSCGGVQKSVNLSLSQPSVPLVIRRPLASTTLDASLAAATTAALELDSLGNVVLPASTQRWWASLDQLSLNGAIMTSLDLDAASVCAAAAAGTVDSYVSSLLGAAPLLLPAPVSEASARRVAVSASQLAEQQVLPVVGASCSVQCAVGDLVPSSAATSSCNATVSGSASASAAVASAASLLDAPVEACVSWLLDDYSECGRTKATSDAAFLKCLSTCNLDPALPTSELELPNWWTTHVNAAASPSAGQSELAAVLDCGTYTLAQQG